MSSGATEDTDHCLASLFQQLPCLVTMPWWQLHLWKCVLGEIQHISAQLPWLWCSGVKSIALASKMSKSLVDYFPRWTHQCLPPIVLFAVWLPNLPSLWASAGLVRLALTQRRWQTEIVELLRWALGDLEVSFVKSSCHIIRNPDYVAEWEDHRERKRPHRVEFRHHSQKWAPKHQMCDLSHFGSCRSSWDL